MVQVKLLNSLTKHQKVIYITTVVVDFDVVMRLCLLLLLLLLSLLLLLLYVGANDYSTWIRYEDGDQSEWESIDELVKGIVRYETNKHKMNADKQIRRRKIKAKEIKRQQYLQRKRPLFG